MRRKFPGYFGRNIFVPGVAETPATWVIPGGDSAPTKIATKSPALWHEWNLPGTCVQSFCSCEMGGVSGPAKGGVSGQPQVHSCYQASGKGRNSTGSSGQNVVFNVPRAETPPPGISLGYLRRKFRPGRLGNGQNLGCTYITIPLLPRRVTLSLVFIFVLDFLSPPLLLSFSE